VNQIPPYSYLSGITNPGELKDLEKLTDFYREHHLKINSTRELESLLSEVTPENPAAKLEEKVSSTLRGQRQGLGNSADRFYADRQERLVKQLTQKARKRLLAGEVDTVALKRLQHKWDSLQRADPERLLRYADITTLKALRDGKLTP
jgi:hypothetical protein